TAGPLGDLDHRGYRARRRLTIRDETAYVNRVHRRVGFVQFVKRFVPCGLKSAVDQPSWKCFRDPEDALAPRYRRKLLSEFLQRKPRLLRIAMPAVEEFRAG